MTRKRKKRTSATVPGVPRNRSGMTREARKFETTRDAMHRLEEAVREFRDVAFPGLNRFIRGLLDRSIEFTRIQDEVILIDENPNLTDEDRERLRVGIDTARGKDSSIIVCSPPTRGGKTELMRKQVEKLRAQGKKVHVMPSTVPVQGLDFANGGQGKDAAEAINKGPFDDAIKDAPDQAGDTQKDG